MAEAGKFDQLAGSVPVAGLEKELETDRKRYAAMHDRFEGLRAELEELNADIQRRERLLEAYREVAEGAPKGPEEGGSELTKPEIARRVLYASVDPLYPRQVRDEAVAKGWLGKDQASHNQLCVSMGKLARKGRLVKGPDGRYRLPRD